MLQGLSAAQAAHRLAREGPNALPGSKPKSIARIMVEVLSEPMFLMLLTAGCIYLALGDRAEALFLLAFVFAVIGTTLAQQRKTQRALESLRDLSAPRALVIRDGIEQRIAGRDVVRGDLLVLHEGDRIAADALLLDGQLSVDESLLSGEAVPVSKTPIQDVSNNNGVPSNGTASDDKANDALSLEPSAVFAAPGGDGTAFIFASTVVTRGAGIAQVRATATSTAVGRIGEALTHTVEPDSALQRSSRHLVRILGLWALLLAAAQVSLGVLWNGLSFLDSLLSGIALAMSILPEEIPVILTVFLALGAWRISKQQVLTRRMAAVEALGTISVLAVDKTGTLTQNRMAVAELTVADAHFNVDGVPSPTVLPETFHHLTEFAMLATPADPYDPMEQAIQRFGQHWLAGTEHIHDSRVAEIEYPLSGEILAMTRVFSQTDTSQHLLATKGAPEAVMDLCHLPAAQRAAIGAQVGAMAQRGLRVLAVAMGRWQSRDLSPTIGQTRTWPTSQHDFTFTFLGLVGLADPLRADVPAAIAQCRNAGVRLIMMTGDHPITARAIARQAGISERPALLTGADIDALNDAALSARLQQVDLCARLQPAHKLRLVRALQASGEVVAMTGDGVNDAPALKAADVGIAMGARGTDVAREAAALVLLDDGFDRIVDAISQGRRIYDNIENAARFAFAVHVPIIALVLVPTLLAWPVLLLPVHIVLLELLIDPACAIVFEADPPAANLMTRPPRLRTASPFALNNLLQGLVQGLGVALLLLLGNAWLAAAGATPVASRSVVFIALVLSVLLLIWANQRVLKSAPAQSTSSNPWLARIVVATASVLILILALPPLRQLMKLTVPDQLGLIAVACLLVLAMIWLSSVRLVRARVIA